MMMDNVNYVHMDLSFNQVDIASQEFLFKHGVKLDFMKICVNYVNKIILLELHIFV